MIPDYNYMDNEQALDAYWDGNGTDCEDDDETEDPEELINYLSDDDVLQEGDEVWLNGDWHPISKKLIGAKVAQIGSVFGVPVKPTFGRPLE